jgi:hypothetical protein
VHERPISGYGCALKKFETRPQPSHFSKGIGQSHGNTRDSRQYFSGNSGATFSGKTAPVRASGILLVIQEVYRKKDLQI